MRITGADLFTVNDVKGIVAIVTGPGRGLEGLLPLGSLGRVPGLLLTLRRA